MIAKLRKIKREKVDRLLLAFSIPLVIFAIFFISTYWFILAQNTILFHSSTTYDTLNVPVHGNHNYQLIVFTHRVTNYPEESSSILRIGIYLDSIYQNTFSVINPIDQTEPTPTSGSISTSGFYNIYIASDSILKLQVDDLVADSWNLTVYKDLSWIYFICNVKFPVFGIIFLMISLIMFNKGRISLKKRKKN